MFLFLFVLKIAVPRVLSQVQIRNLASKYGLIYVPNNDKFEDMLNVFLCMGKLAVVDWFLLHTRFVGF